MPATLATAHGVCGLRVWAGFNSSALPKKGWATLAGSAQQAFLRRHRDEALQERERGDYEQTDARSRARWQKPFFFLSGSCVSVYRWIESVQDFFLATPEMSSQLSAVSCLGGWMCVGKDSFRTLHTHEPRIHSPRSRSPEDEQQSVMSPFSQGALKRWARWGTLASSISRRWWEKTAAIPSPPTTDHSSLSASPGLPIFSPTASDLGRRCCPRTSALSSRIPA